MKLVTCVIYIYIHTCMYIWTSVFHHSSQNNNERTCAWCSFNRLTLPLGQQKVQRRAGQQAHGSCLWLLAEPKKFEIFQGCHVCRAKTQNNRLHYLRSNSTMVQPSTSHLLNLIEALFASRRAIIDAARKTHGQLAPTHTYFINITGKIILYRILYEHDII